MHVFKLGSVRKPSFEICGEVETMFLEYASCYKVRADAAMNGICGNSRQAKNCNRASNWEFLSHRANFVVESKVPHIFFVCMS